MHGEAALCISLFLPIHSLTKTPARPPYGHVYGNWVPCGPRQTWQGISEAPRGVMYIQAYIVDTACTLSSTTAPSPCELVEEDKRLGEHTWVKKN